MEAVIEKECSALGGLFQTIISDMKVDDLIKYSCHTSRASKGDAKDMCLYCGKASPMMFVGSYPVWEDFINKAGKLQSQLRTTVVAAAAFLDAFQKVADMATNTRGSLPQISEEVENRFGTQISMLRVGLPIRSLRKQVQKKKNSKVASTKGD